MVTLSERATIFSFFAIAHSHYGSEQPEVETYDHSLSHKLRAEWASQQLNEHSEALKQSNNTQPFPTPSGNKSVSAVTHWTFHEFDKLTKPKKAEKRPKKEAYVSRNLGIKRREKKDKA